LNFVLFVANLVDKSPDQPNPKTVLPDESVDS